MRRLLALLLFAAACTPDGPRQYLVPDVRILAVRASLPGPSRSADAEVAEPLTVEALVANPLARAPVTVDWYACPVVGAPPRPPTASPCRDPDVLQRVDALPRTVGVLSGGVLPFALDTDGSGGVASATLDLAAHGAALGLPDEVLRIVAASTVPLLQCTLYAEVPLVAVARAPGLAEVAIKTARVHPQAALALAASVDPTSRNAYAFNLNPGFPSAGGIRVGATDPAVCADGVPVGSTTLSTGRTTLCAALEDGSIDIYDNCEEDGPVAPRPQEQIDWQWYATAGEFADADFSGNVTARDASFTPASGPSTIWVIARDGRGGTAWERRDLVVP